MKEIAICAFLLAKRLALGGAKQAGPRKAQPPGPSRQNIHGSNPARRASSAIAIGKFRRIIRRECGSSEELAERTREAGPSARTSVLGRDDNLIGAGKTPAGRWQPAGVSNLRRNFRRAPTLDVVVHLELVGMGTQTHGVHFLLALVVDESVQHLLGEDVALEQELVVAGERVESALQRTGHGRDLRQLLRSEIVDVLVERLPGIDLA